MEGDNQLFGPRHHDVAVDTADIYTSADRIEIVSEELLRFLVPIGPTSIGSGALEHLAARPGIAA